MAESALESKPASELVLEETIISAKFDATDTFRQEAWQSNSSLASLDQEDFSSRPKLDLDLDSSTPKRGKWVSLGGVSYHADRDAGFNEQNYGLGYEQDISENSAIAFGAYRNSIDRNSTYALYHWTPLQKGPFKLGLMGGAVTGYEIPVMPLVLPMLKVEGKRVGTNLFCIPKIENISGVCAAQIKVNLDI